MYFCCVAVTPEPDSTEDSTGGLEPPDLPLVRVAGKSPTRRMSQPITGSPKDQEKSTNRRASEGKDIQIFPRDLDKKFCLFIFKGVPSCLQELQCLRMARIEVKWPQDVKAWVLTGGQMLPHSLMYLFQPQHLEMSVTSRF